MDFNIDFRLELPHIDKICDGEIHVVEKIVECTDKVQVLRKFLVNAWLSSARVVRCWVKSRNERNPYC